MADEKETLWDRINPLKISPIEYTDFLKDLKKGWADGPWQTEPDVFEFRYKGINCVLRRSVIGAWCGYVCIPKDNPYCFKRDYEDINVHGGITYEDEEKESDGSAIIGFDCGHIGDIVPAMFTIMKRHHKFRDELVELSNLLVQDPGFKGQVYRDINYAMHECENIVDQITKGV